MFKKNRFLKAATSTLCAAFLMTILNIAASAQNGLPPLIDREILFGNPEIAGAQISPDGKYIMFRKPYKGVLNIHVKKADAPFDQAKLITNRSGADRPIAGAFWSRDSKYILFSADKGGDENFNVYAVNPAEEPKAGEEVPTARNLTDGKAVRAQIVRVPENETDTIYVGINERDKAWHDLYKVKISTGERTLIRENKDRSGGLIFDNAEKMRLAIRNPPNGSTEVLRLDADGTAKMIYSCGLFDSCYPVRFHKDNKRVYMVTNKGDEDLSRLILLDVETGKEELVESDPLKRVDFGGAAFSDLTDEMIFTSYTDDRSKIYWKDKAWEADYKFLQGKYPNKEINFGSRTTDEQLVLVTVYSDTEPGETVLFNRKTKAVTPQYKVRQKIDRSALASVKSIRYKSSDGLEIPAYLTLPKGVPAKNLPVVVFPHGGPWARDFWGYDPWAQFLANRGYAVLQPNFRASTGYGRKFLNAGNKQWGALMQDDITAGVNYLVSEGIADKKRVGIMGISYGGYATLAGLAYTPDVYAAGVAIVAPANLQTLLDAIPPYWEAGRTLMYARMGDPNTPEGKEALKKQSPLFIADKIKAPLLVVQGKNDPRVNVREAEQIVVALRDRGFPVEYILAPDEGHGFQRPVNNMAMLTRAEEFLAKHLGGRYQKDATPEVTARLKEITVDPKTVSFALAKTADANAAPSVNLGGKWDVTADAGGQQLPITIEFKQDGAALSGSLSSQVGGGTITDGKVSGNQFTANATVDVQGQSVVLKIEGTIEGSKITGTMNGAGIPPVTFSGTKAN